jgi:two-component system OmpR family response regulator
VPVESHVSIAAPEHWVAPGAHVPWHMPLTHAWLVQESAGPQAPLSLQVCTPLPWSEHRVDWGAHSPVQAPSTHARLPQSIGAPQCPVPSQIWTPLFAHCVACGVQLDDAPSSGESVAASDAPSSAFESVVASDASSAPASAVPSPPPSDTEASWRPLPPSVDASSKALEEVPLVLVAQPAATPPSKMAARIPSCLKKALMTNRRASTLESGAAHVQSDSQKVVSRSDWSDRGQGENALHLSFPASTGGNLPHLMGAPRILVVDDDPDIRRMAALSLERIGGFSVTLAAGGEEALGAVALEAPDVILLDVTMPGTDGPATLLALRKLPSGGAIPVVFFTATSSADETLRLVALGAIGVIPKPFEVADLPRRVREILARAG